MITDYQNTLQTVYNQQVAGNVNNQEITQEEAAALIESVGLGASSYADTMATAMQGMTLTEAFMYVSQIMTEADAADGNADGVIGSNAPTLTFDNLMFQVTDLGTATENTQDDNPDVEERLLAAGDVFKQDNGLTDDMYQQFIDTIGVEQLVSVTEDTNNDGDINILDAVSAAQQSGVIFSDVTGFNIIVGVLNFSTAALDGGYSSEISTDPLADQTTVQASEETDQDGDDNGNGEDNTGDDTGNDTGAAAEEDGEEAEEDGEEAEEDGEAAEADGENC